MNSFAWQAVVERLGWTLVHSVWQLTLVAIVAAGWERVLQRRSATARYGMLLTMLAAVVVAPVTTAVLLTETPATANRPVVSNSMQEPVDSRGVIGSEPVLPADDSGPSLRVSSSTRSVEPHSIVPHSWIAVARDAVQPWLAVIVGLWCVGVFACAARPILSWHTVRRLRTVGVSAVPGDVQQVLDRMAKRLRLPSAVQVLQSTLVTVPVVIGYFRPLILLPVSLVTGLSVSQWEAILAHELAHIRRHDYLVNALQTLVETLFFYHPAVWWLSWRIRCERENCCDDLAVAVLGNRLAYGRALLTLEELRGVATPLAIGARSGSLVARVRRLLEREPAERRFPMGTGGLIGVGGLAVAIVMLGIWAGTQANEPPSKPVAAPSAEAPAGEFLPPFLKPDEKSDEKQNERKDEVKDEKKKAEPPSRNSRLDIVLRPTDKNSPPIGEHIVRRVFVDRNFVTQMAVKNGPRFEDEFRPEEFGRKCFLLIDVPGYTPVKSAEFTTGPSMPPLEIDLPPAVNVPVRGRVVDADIKPIAEARILVRRIYHGSHSQFPWGPEATTDADGRFTLRNLRAGEQLMLYADKPGVGQAETTAFMLTPDDAKNSSEWLLCIVPANQTVSGRVTDQDGLAVPKAKVTFHGEPKRETSTDAEGRFRLTDLPQGRLPLSLRADDGSQSKPFVQAGATDVHLFLPLRSLYNRPEYRLPVTVRAAVGQLGRAKYYLLDLTTKRWRQSGEIKRDGRLDLDMHSMIRLHGDHAFALFVLADGFAASPLVPVVTQPKLQPVTVELRPAAPVTLRGRVIDRGQPLAGVTIGLSRHLADGIQDDPWSYLGGTPETLPVTADDGTFEITGLNQGLRVAVYVNQPGRTGAWSPRILLEGPPVTLADIELGKSDRKLTGRVVTKDNQPVHDARVVIHNFSQPSTTTNSTGRFELSSIPHGPLVFTVYKLGFQDPTRQLKPEEAEGQVVVQLEADPNQFVPPPTPAVLIVPGKQQGALRFPIDVERAMLNDRIGPPKPAKR